MIFVLGLVHNVDFATMRVLSANKWFFGEKLIEDCLLWTFFKAHFDVAKTRFVVFFNNKEIIKKWSASKIIQLEMKKPLGFEKKPSSVHGLKFYYLQF